MSAETWQPDLQFYAQNERSWAIRSLCLEILYALEKVSKNKARPDAYQIDLHEEYARLEVFDGMLIDLEIEFGLHPDIALDDADPVTVAEWLAGNLKPWTGPDLDTLPPETLDMLLDTFYVYLDASPSADL